MGWAAWGEKGLGGRAFNVNSASSYVVHVAVFNTVLYIGGPNTALALSLVGNMLHCTVAHR